MEEDRFKACPYCGEKIRKEALKCKHCGSWVASPERKCSWCDEIIPEDADIPAFRSHWIMCILSTVVTLILLGVILIFSLGHVVWLLLAFGVCAVITVDRLLIFLCAEYSICKDRICAVHYRFFGIGTDGFVFSDVDRVTVGRMNAGLDCGDIVIRTKDGKNHVLWSVIAPEQFVSECNRSMNNKTEHYE